MNQFLDLYTLKNELFELFNNNISKIEINENASKMTFKINNITYYIKKDIFDDENRHRLTSDDTNDKPLFISDFGFLNHIRDYFKQLHDQLLNKNENEESNQENNQSKIKDQFNENIIEELRQKLTMKDWLKIAFEHDIELDNILKNL